MHWEDGHPKKKTENLKLNVGGPSLYLLDLYDGKGISVNLVLIMSR
jgi:hypothetical protein